MLTLASAVVFVTTYALVLPAITLEIQKVIEDNTLGITLENGESESAQNTEETQNVENQDNAQNPENEAQSQEVAPENKNLENNGEANLQNGEVVQNGEVSQQNNEQQTTQNTENKEQTQNASQENAQVVKKELELIKEETTLYHLEENYFISAKFDENARFPVGVDLKVNEISPTDPSYETYKNKIEDIFFEEEDKTLSFVQLFDIRFEHEGVEYQPAGEVSIKINYQEGPEAEANNNFHIIHFKDSETAEVFESESTLSKKLEDISVKTNTFSVYAVTRSANSDTVTIAGKTYYIVTFNYLDSAGNNKSSANLVEAIPNATIGTLPQDPFVAGKRFIRWVDASGNTVGPSTPVTGSMQINAEFEEIEQYEVRVDYIYYNNALRRDVVFDTEVFKLAEYDIPYTIETPKSSIVKRTDDSTLTNDAIYYPDTTQIIINSKQSLDAKDAADGTVDKKATYQHRYIPTDAVFYYVYKLKNLHDNNYSDVKRVEGRGKVGSTVTPPIENIPYAEWERSEPTEIYYEEGQEIPVFYRRGNVNITYESNGGTYVPRKTGIYGTEAALPSPPTKTGYTFEGWYEDAALTKKITSENVVLDKDKTLYAKWNPASVKYTILYYRYEYDENDYIGNTTHEQNEAVQPKERFIGSVEANALTGSTINASAIGDFTGIDVSTGLAYTYGYQKYAAKNNTSIVVQPDGSSVIKVYYEPKTYTYEFRTNRNAGVITHLGVNEGNSYSFTARTGQYIAQKWPVNWTGTNRTITSGDANLTFLRWAYAGGTQGSVTMQQFVSNEHLQKADATNKITYNAMWANSNDGIFVRQSNGRVITVDKYGVARVNYYFEKEGQPGVYERNALQSEDIAFDKLADVTAKGFTGYDVLNAGELRALAASYPRTRQENKPVQNGTTRVGNTVYPTYPDPPVRQQTDVHNKKTYDRIFEFYYKFKRYEIQYKYNGEEAAPTKVNLINGTDINNAVYNFTPDRPAGVDADYTWGGWYEDAKLLNPVFNGSNPLLIDGNKIFYAKWIPPKFNVNFELNGGTSTSPIATQRLDKYQKVTIPTEPTKKFHTFEGWYTAPTGGTEFDFTTPITKNTTLYARWKLKPIEYTVRYLDAETGNPILSEKHIQGPDLKLGQVITEEATAVPGYRPQQLTGQVTLTDNFDNNVINLYYDKRNANLTYTVEYVLQSDPTKKVAATKIETAGATVVKVRELAKAVDKKVMAASGITGDALQKDYYPVDQSKELVISSNSANNKIVFEYVERDTAVIEINYFDMDGNRIPGHDKKVLFLNTPNVLLRDEHKKDISGFTFEKTVDGSNVQNKEAYVFNTGQKTIINYYYKKNLVVKPRSDTKIYDGTPLKLTDGSTSDAIVSTDTPLARGHKIAQIVYDNETITNVGSVNPTITRLNITDSQNVNKNNYYNITFDTGKLTITPKPVTVTVTGEQKTVEYNGQNHQATFTITSDDPTYYSGSNTNNITVGSINYNAQKNAGSYTLNLQGKFTNNNPNYNPSFRVSNGKVTITPKPVTLTSGSASFAYDGTEKTHNVVTSEGFITGEGMTAHTTTTKIEPGVYDNEFEYTLNANTLARNYTINTVNGTITILPTVNIQKTNMYWEVLGGARFNLEKLNGTNWTAVQKDTNFLVDANGYNLSGLEAGRYRLKELQAPNGYLVLTNYIYFDIVYDAQNHSYEVVPKTGNDGLATNKMRVQGKAEDYSHRLQAQNEFGTALPNTGGIGSHIYRLSGLSIITIAILLYVLDRNKKIKLQDN